MKSSIFVIAIFAVLVALSAVICSQAQASCTQCGEQGACSVQRPILHAAATVVTAPVRLVEKVHENRCAIREARQARKCEACAPACATCAPPPCGPVTLSPVPKVPAPPACAPAAPACAPAAPACAPAGGEAHEGHERHRLFGWLRRRCCE